MCACADSREQGVSLPSCFPFSRCLHMLITSHSVSALRIITGLQRKPRRCAKSLLVWQRAVLTRFGVLPFVAYYSVNSKKVYWVFYEEIRLAGCRLQSRLSSGCCSVCRLWLGNTTNVSRKVPTEQAGVCLSPHPHNALFIYKILRPWVKLMKESNPQNSF